MKYRTPEAFRQALEARIIAGAKAKGLQVNRYRRVVLAEAFLARIFERLGRRVMLKGGMALELRLSKARATKDVDLRLAGDLASAVATIREAGSEELSFLTFIVAEAEHADIEAAVYGGKRCRVQARLGGAEYGEPFGLDVAGPDSVTANPDEHLGNGLFAFAEVEPTPFYLYPRVTHVAEKLHAYTLRPEENSRVKDLPDIALLAQAQGGYDAAELRAAIEATFAARATHPVPANLPDPRASWAAPYARIAHVSELDWPTLAEVYEAARRFLDPVLAGAEGSWWVDTETWSQ